MYEYESLKYIISTILSIHEYKYYKDTLSIKNFPSDIVILAHYRKLHSLSPLPHNLKVFFYLSLSFTDCSAINFFSSSRR